MSMKNENIVVNGICACAPEHWRGHRLMRTLAFGCVALLSGASPLVAAGAAQAESGTGIPYSRILRDPGAPYNGLIESFVLGTGGDARVGPGGGLSIGGPAVAAGANLQIPLLARGAAPQDATLKLGNLYITVPDASAGLIYSDNANASEKDPESGWISVVESDVIFVLQLNEGLRLTMSGALIWLPGAGRVGFGGLGLYDPFEIGPYFSASRLLNIGATYDFELGGWDMRFLDVFSVDAWWGSGSARMNTQLGLLESGNFDGSDSLGRYSLGREFTDRSRNRDNRDSEEDRFSNDGLVLRNTAGYMATRVLPTVTRCLVSAFHSNYWYTRSRDRSITWDETASVAFISERPNLRFKPYAAYEVNRSDQEPDWDHWVRAGVFGPITRNLEVFGEVGHWWDGNSNDEETTWTLGLDHRPGPQTHQRISVKHTVTQPAQEVMTTAGYEVSRTLGPELMVIGLADYRHYEAGRDGTDEREEYDLGGRLVYHMGDRIEFRLSQTFTRDVPLQDGDATEYDEWVTSAGFECQLSKTVRGSLLYQWTDRNSSAVGDSYTENMVYLRLTKFFR